MLFHSRVILPLSWELLTSETHVVLISVPLVPSTAPGTHKCLINVDGAAG